MERRRKMGLAALLVAFALGLSWLMDQSPVESIAAVPSVPWPKGPSTPVLPPPTTPGPAPLATDVIPDDADENLPPHAGGRRTESAVDVSLTWSQRHQDIDGFWSLSDFGRHCGTYGRQGCCDGAGDSSYDLAGTGLMMLSRTGRGNDHKTPDRNRASQLLHSALGYLLRLQNPDGSFGSSAGPLLFNHVVATCALADLYSMSDDRELLPPLEKALQFLLEARHKEGGWCLHSRHNTGRPWDEEVDGLDDADLTLWGLLALKTAQGARVTVDDAVFDGVRRWLDILDGDDPPRPHAAAAGLWSRVMLRHERGLWERVDVLLTQLPDWSRHPHDFGSWYYGSKAMFAVGGDYWNRWNEAMKSTLTKNMANKRALCEFGTWDPAHDVWGRQGGRVYTAAMGALCLEVYYAYVREPMKRPVKPPSEEH